jgi:sugar (pentulose or hexulose) kinase
VELVVGIDIATAAVRAEACDATGTVYAEGTSKLPEPVSPQPGWSEQDASSWWPAVAGTLRQLTGRLGKDSRSIVALSVSSTSGTVAALDVEGEPVAPALTYADQRAGHEAEIAQEAGEPRWRALGLTIQPSFGLPKMAWLAARTPARRFASPADLVVEKLIDGVTPTDWSHALKSGYDPLRGEWATEAMAPLGVEPSLLPEVRRPTELAGTVGAGAAQSTGLPSGCEVRLGMTDSCASQLAAGAGSPGKFVSVLGSTLVLKGVSRELLADPTGAVYSHRHPDGWWLPGGASSTGGRCLGQLFAGRDLRHLDDQAAAHGPARILLYPLPVRGERFPFVEIGRAHV